MPVLFEECQLPEALSKIQAVTLFENDEFVQEQLNKLVDALKNIRKKHFDFLPFKEGSMNFDAAFNVLSATLKCAEKCFPHHSPTLYINKD